MLVVHATLPVNVDKAAFDAHLTSPHFAGAGELLPPILAGAPEIV